MSDLEQFAQWLVKNQDKRGTQEFETVANQELIFLQGV